MYTGRIATGWATFGHKNTYITFCTVVSLQINSMGLADCAPTFITITPKFWIYAHSWKPAFVRSKLARSARQSTVFRLWICLNCLRTVQSWGLRILLCPGFNWSITLLNQIGNLYESSNTRWLKPISLQMARKPQGQSLINSFSNKHWCTRSLTRANSTLFEVTDPSINERQGLFPSILSLSFTARSTK